MAESEENFIYGFVEKVRERESVSLTCGLGVIVVLGELTILTITDITSTSHPVRFAFFRNYIQQRSHTFGK